MSRILNRNNPTTLPSPHNYQNFDEYEREYVDTYIRIQHQTFDELAFSIMQSILHSSRRYHNDLVVFHDYGSGCCADCAIHIGRVYSISGRNKKFPKLPEYAKNHGNFHSGCRCTISSYFDGTNVYHNGIEVNAVISSNRPYIDDRTSESKSRYLDYISNLFSDAHSCAAKEWDQNEYSRLVNSAIVDVPKSFGSYRRMKNANTSGFQKLQVKASENGIYLTDRNVCKMTTRYYKDILLPDAVEIVLTSGVVSAGRIQNNLQIGPNRAIRLIDEMESLGIIGPAQGNRPRAILMTLDEWYENKHTFLHLEEPVRPTPPTQTTGAAMYCRHCGKQLSASSKFCDGCGKSTSGEDAPKKKKKKHPVLGIIAAVLAFFFVIGSCDNSDPEAPQKVDPASPSTTATKSAPTTYGIGDRLEKGGVYATLNDVYEVDGSLLLEPNAGNVFVLCDFTIENNTKEDLIVSSVLNFKAYFDDYAVEYSIGALSSKDSSMQLDSTIAPGKKIKGVVGYEVPEGWKYLEISYQPDLLSSNTFTFNYSR